MQVFLSSKQKIHNVMISRNMASFANYMPKRGQNHQISMCLYHVTNINANHATYLHPVTFAAQTRPYLTHGRHITHTIERGQFRGK